MLSADRHVIVGRRMPDFFCRADLWQAGVEASRGDRIVMLDCDRIADGRFFHAANQIVEGEALYCSNLYQACENVHGNVLRGRFSGPVGVDVASPDGRALLTGGTLRPRKNPMSGCVAFDRRTYAQDPWFSREFVGWGFNDSDAYVKAFFCGVKITGLPLREFHLHHDHGVRRRKLLAMNAWNSVLFHDKWMLNPHEDLSQLYAHLCVDPAFLRQISLQEYLEIA